MLSVQNELILLGWLIIESFMTCNISSIFSSNSEAFASELLENLEEMFPRYIHSGSLKASTTQWCATVAEELLVCYERMSFDINQ